MMLFYSSDNDVVWGVREGGGTNGLPGTASKCQCQSCVNGWGGHGRRKGGDALEGGRGGEGARERVKWHGVNTCCNIVVPRESGK